jgi:5-methylthioadenosine/S-adenosylhomocysteine deaminase
MRRLLIRGARVLGFEDKYDEPPVADILIEDGVVSAIAPNLSVEAGAPGQRVNGPYVIDARDRLAVPGFVNSHYHSHDTLLKGAFEALPLDIWAMLALPPAFTPRSAGEIRVRTLVGAAECLLRGITTVQDMVRLHPYAAEHFDVVLKAYEEIGIRAVVAPHYNDLAGTNSAAFWDEEIPAGERWRLAGPAATFAKDTDIIGLIRDTVAPRAKSGGVVRLGLGPSAPERCSEKLLEATAALSAEHDLPVFTHVAETRGKTLHARLNLAAHGHSHISYLGDCGLLGPRLAIAHAVWLEPEEIAAIGRAGASVVLNPQGNLKTRSGIAPIGVYRKVGVNVALGCDNCSCNDSQSMLQAMKAYAGLGAIEQPYGDTPAASDALHSATAAGARALGMRDVGRLAPGTRGDVVLFRLDEMCFVPLNSAVRQLVFGDAAPALETVIVDGRVVVDHGRLLTLDLAALRREAEAYATELRRELGDVTEKLRPLFADIERAAERAQATEWRLSAYAAGSKPH